MTSFIADQAPSDAHLTDYDRAHLTLYLRLLDAHQEQAGWSEVASMLLAVDPDQEPERAQVRYETHLARAKWMADQGYMDLLKSR
ncbi:DNA -binding domain-containing protein [Phenylobacterium sp.]|uniref:DNA -binding domain-containing protein n=1 Tax=Phenylobacterium sp. TaxID=1871053 RepID=UPI003D2E2E36